MTNAIIDNSTISSVERVIGNIPVHNDYDISGDLSAFEQYLSAMIFYDNPVRIDDYKEEYSEDRKKNFGELGTVAFEKESYDELLRFAQEKVEGIYLSINGGNVEQNDIGKFLDDLDLHVCPAWQMQSSDFFLRIRLLSDKTGAQIEKYSPLMSAIFDQMSEIKSGKSKPNWNKRLVASDGNLIKNIDGDKKNPSYTIGKDVNAFSAGLNWIALRSVFYSIVSEKLEGVAVCHPIRSDFLARFYSEQLNMIGPDQRAAILDYFRTTTLEGINRSNALLGGPAFKLEAPLISAWATLKTGSPKEARNFVNDIRYSSEATALRARLRDVETLISGEEMADARKYSAKIFKDYQIAANDLFRKYSAKDEDPFGISANIVTMTGSFKVIAAADKIASLMPKRRRSMALLRNITLDLLQSPQLGKVSDMFRSSRLLEGDPWDGPSAPKIDHPKFKYARSNWKKPM